MPPGVLPFYKDLTKLLGIGGNIRVCGKPDPFVGLDMVDQLFQNPEAGTIADNVGVHGQLKDAAFGVSAIELPAENIENIRGSNVWPQGTEALHQQIGRVIANPFHGQFNNAGIFPIQQ